MYFYIFYFISHIHEAYILFVHTYSAFRQKFGLKLAGLCSFRPYRITKEKDILQDRKCLYLYHLFPISFVSLLCGSFENNEILKDLVYFFAKKD